MLNCQQVLSPYHAMGCNPMTMVDDPLGLQFHAPANYNPSYSIPNAGVVNIEGQKVIFGASSFSSLAMRQLRANDRFTDFLIEVFLRKTLGIGNPGAGKKGGSSADGTGQSGGSNKQSGGNKEQSEFLANGGYVRLFNTYFQLPGHVDMAHNQGLENSGSHSEDESPAIWEEYQHETAISGWTYTAKRLTPYGEMWVAEQRAANLAIFQRFTPLGRAISVVQGISELIDKYEPGENIGMERFTQRLRKGGWKDPKSKEYLEKDRGRNSGGGENGSNHGPSWWKLYSKEGYRIGTISKEGLWLRP